MSLSKELKWMNEINDEIEMFTLFWIIKISLEFKIVNSFEIFLDELDSNSLVY